MDGLKSHLSRLFDLNKEDLLIPHKDLKFHNEVRSEERRVGKECVP